MNNLKFFYTFQKLLVNLFILNGLSSVQGFYNSKCSYGSYGTYCDKCGVVSQQQNLIVGGITATAHSWPSIALLRFDYKLDIKLKNGKTVTHKLASLCAGTLIDRSTVLTAAHCIFTEDEAKFDEQNYTFNITPNQYYPTYGSMYTIFLGLHDISSIDNNNDISPAEKVSVSTVIYHADFNSNDTGVYNDIALLILSKEVTLNEFIQIACLPESNTDDFPNSGVPAYVAGWGYTSSEEILSSLLQNVKITVYNNSNCPSHYSLKSNQICAGELAGGKDTCQGDSGGPLFVQGTINSQKKFILAGITSFGDVDGCALAGIPGAYTRVSSFLDWINDASRTKKIILGDYGNNSQMATYNIFFIFTCFIFLYLILG